MKRGEYSPTDIPASKIPLVIYWIPAVATAHLTCSNCFSFFFSQKPWSEPCVQTPTDRRGKKTFQKDENIPGQDLTASKFYRYLELNLYAAILKVCVRLCVCTCVCVCVEGGRLFAGIGGRLLFHILLFIWDLLAP